MLKFSPKCIALLLIPCKSLVGGAVASASFGPAAVDVPCAIAKPSSAQHHSVAGLANSINKMTVVAMLFYVPRSEEQGMGVASLSVIEGDHGSTPNFIKRVRIK